jgi:RimJ/RimL family protein N-acetyltransferase
MGINGHSVPVGMGWSIENGPEIGYWVAKELNAGYFAERSQAIGLVKNGEIVAGVIYENWNGRSLMVHLVIKDRITPAFLGAVFDYGFNVCKIEKAIAPVSSSNLKMIGMIEKMGFAEEGRIKDATPDGDIVLYTMKKADCRFLGNRYGKKYSSTAYAA